MLSLIKEVGLAGKDTVLETANRVSAGVAAAGIGSAVGWSLTPAQVTTIISCVVGVVAAIAHLVINWYWRKRNHAVLREYYRDRLPPLVEQEDVSHAASKLTD